mmetsp:Transcript_35966/g.84001  ORF Transcript_35966/g.84001 Transcript_35966/m.84001 type:complete len:91 (+) Transcript_35966:407-679(+)
MSHSAQLSFFSSIGARVVSERRAVRLVAARGLASPPLLATTLRQHAALISGWSVATLHVLALSLAPIVSTSLRWPPFAQAGLRLASCRDR